MRTGIGYYNLEEDEFAKIKTSKDLYVESVNCILNTTPGELPFNTDFGCALKSLLFENDVFYLERSASYFISYALEKFEPDLEFVSISVKVVDPSSHLIRLYMTLKIKETAETFDNTIQIIL